MTFKDAYKTLKKLPDYNFLRNCFDWGDSWEFGFTPYIVASGEVVFGCADFINKETGKTVSGTSFYAEPNRNIGKSVPIPVPRFAAEGWDYYDPENKTFKLKPGAPYWAKDEFDEFYETGGFQYEAAQVAEPVQTYGEKP
jgi:hypothetical protein